MAKPAIPTGFKVTRLGDRDFKFEWTTPAGATSCGIRLLKGSQVPPYTPWVSGLKGSSFIGRRFSGEAGLQFGLYAENKDGTSGYATLGETFYLPLPKPISLKVKVDAALGRATLTWAFSGYYQAGLQVERETNGVSELITMGSGTSGPIPKTWVDTAATQNVRYRVRYFAGGLGDVVDGVQQTRVYGAWSDWSPVFFAGYRAPLAPLVDLANTAVGVAPRVPFRHQSADGTIQEAARVRYRKTGSSTWIIITRAAQNFADLPSNLVAGEYEVQVQTKGASTEYSEWSPVQTFLMVTRPVVTITGPTSPYSGGKATATWSVAQAEGIPQSAFTATRFQGSTVIEQLAVLGAAKAAPFGATLSQVTYRDEIVASCAGVPSLPTSNTFTVSFTPPATPNLAAVWDDEEGACQVTVSKGVGGAATTKILVYRSVDQGLTWESLGDYVVGGTFFDYESVSYGATAYLAVAETALGALATREVAVHAQSSGIWLHTSDGRGVGLKANPEFTVSAEPAHQELVFFDGDTIPTLIEDTPKSMLRTVSLSADTIPQWLESAPEDDALLAELRRLIAAPGLVTARLPNGMVLKGILKDHSENSPVGALTRVSLSFSEAKT